MNQLTWWGHSFATLRLGDITVATDPLAGRWLFHLRRHREPPAIEAFRSSVVVVSHLHHDHLHMPTLKRFAPGTTFVVPRGAPSEVRALRDLDVVEASPGDHITVGHLEIDILPAKHDGRRLPHRPLRAPAIGFRMRVGEVSCWYPGDTGVQDLSGVGPVDLALVPIGGWGPSLGSEHLDPAEAADAVRDVGARYAVPVHYGTLWPMGLRHLSRRSHRHFFITPPERFQHAMADAAPETTTLIPDVGEQVSW